MQLKLKHNRASQLELREADSEEKDETDFELRYRTIFEQEQLQKFSVEFLIRLTIENTHRLTVVYRSEFEASEEFGQDFKESAFAEVNAPAIAFPFIRSYIAHITLIAGFESVILPSVNFTVKDSDLNHYRR